MKQKHFLLLFLALLMSLGARAQDVITLSDFGNKQSGNTSKWPTGIPAGTNGAGTAKVRGFDNGIYDVAYGNLRLNLDRTRLIFDNTNSYIQLPVVPGYKIAEVRGTFNIDEATQTRKINLIEVPVGENLSGGTVVKSFVYNEGIDSETGEVTFDSGEITAKTGAQYKIAGGQNGYISLTSITVTYYKSTLEPHGVFFSKDKCVCELTPGQDPATANLVGLLPTLTNINHLTGLKYTSSNPSVATIDDNGIVTPKGIGRTIIVVSRPADTKYEEVHETYTLIIDDPTNGSSLNIYNKTNLKDGDNLKGMTLLDDCENVSFTFNNPGGETPPVYTTKKTDNFYGLKTFKGNTITIKNLKDGYYIDHVKLTLEPKIPNYLPTLPKVSAGTFDSSKMEWSFDGLNLTEGVLTIDQGTSNIQFISDITVYLRKPVFTIAANPGSPNVKEEGTIDMKDWFVIDNLISAADKDNIVLTYKVKEGEDDNVVSHEGSSVFKGLKGAAGKAVTIEASYVPTDDSKYASANTASIVLHVLEKDPYTVTGVSDKTIALYGNNGFNTYDAKTGIKFNKDDGTAATGGTYSVSIPEDNGVVNKKDDTTFLETIAEGTVEVSVTYTPSEADAEMYSATTAKFQLTVKDARTTLAASFGKKVYSHLTTTPASEFVSPELTLPANSGLTAANFGWSSDNTAVATVDENGKVTLTGATGNANIKAVLPKATETNYNYLPFEASYKIVVVNPTESALELAPVLAYEENQGKAITNAKDESEIVSFAFEQAGVSAASRLVMYNNGSVTVAVDKQKYPYYFLESVEFVPVQGATMDGATVEVGTVTGNIWSFDGVNATSALLKNSSGSSKNFTNVIVKLRLANVSMTVKAVDVESKGQSLTIADYITIKAQDGSELSPEDKAAVVAALEYGVIENTSVVAYAEEKGKVTVKGIGTVDVPVSFPGIANKYQANSVDVTINVVDQPQYTITVDPAQVKFNYNLDPIALPDITVTCNGETVEVVPVITLAEDENRIVLDTENNVIKIKKGEGAITDGDVVVVTVSVANDGDTLGDTETFDVILSDDRLAPTLKFAAESIDYDATSGKNFVAPALTVSGVADIAAARAALTWTATEKSSNDEEETSTHVQVNNGTVTIAKDLKGKYAVTIKAAIADKNATYKPVKASYVINVKGTPMTVAEYTANETEEFYVKGRISAIDGNSITIVDANTTAPSMTVVLASALANAKEGNTVFVEGVKNGEVLNAIAARMLPNVNIQTTYRTILEGNDVSVVNLPNGVTVKDITVTSKDITVNPSENVKIEGNKITFNKTGDYILTVSTAETANYSETTAEFKVIVYTEPEYLEGGQNVISTMPENGKLQLVVSDNETILYTFAGENGEYSEAENGVIDFSGKAGTSGSVWVKSRITNDDVSETSVVRLVYDFTTTKAQVAVGLAVSPSDAMYNSASIKVRVDSDNYNYEWTKMEFQKMVSHDKKLYVATIPVPTFEATSLKGYVGSINDDIIPLADNTYTNASKAALAKSGLDIIFEDADGNKLSFKNAPLMAEKDGVENQVVIFSDDVVYSEMYIFDAAGNNIGSLSNFTGDNGMWEDKLVNKTVWVGDLPVAAKGGFYLATAMKDGKAAGTILHASSSTPAQAPAMQRVMRKAAATSSIVKHDGESTINAITPKDGETFAKIEANSDGTYAATMGSRDDVMTSVADIAADDDADVMWYNLNGVRIAAPTQSGVYVRVKGGKAEKVIVRE